MPSEIGQDRRCEKRYPTNRIRVSVYAAGNSKHDQCVLINVARNGCFVSGLEPETDSVELIIHPPNSGQVTRKAKVQRTGCGDEAGWFGARLDLPLSDLELKSMTSDGIWTARAPASDEPLQLALSDRVEIEHELREIKNCRSRIFLWTLGLVGTACAGVWTLNLEGKLTWLGTLWATWAVFGAFIIGALSLAEKGRAVCCREGYLASLALILTKGAAPERYLGWENYKAMLNDCGVMERIGHCPRGKEEYSEVLRCHQEGLIKAKALHSARWVFPGVFDSYMTLSTFIFGVMYLVVVSLLIVSTSKALAIYRGTPFWWSTGAMLIGVGISMLAVRLVGIKNLLYLLTGLLLSVAIGVLPGLQSLTLAAAAMIGMALGASGWVLLSQLWEVRAGKHSFYTYVYTWQTMFVHCRHFFEDAWQAKEYEDKSLIRRCFRYLMSRIARHSLDMEDIKKEREQ